MTLKTTFSVLQVLKICFPNLYVYDYLTNPLPL